ncbi:hypothetical protein TNCV_1610401 [Trichonephila clavipes]|nr:hypothetical protein TNCV_1610401 [Trichonephila clavipes]
MSLRRWQVQCHQLIIEERDCIIELHDSGLSLSTVATHVGRNVSTIQWCVTQWIQKSLCKCRRGNGAHSFTSECTKRRIRQLTIGDHFFKSRDIRNRLPLGAGGSVSIQTMRNRLHEVHLLARTRRLEWCHCQRT